MRDLKNKQVVVLGLDPSGLAARDFLQAAGAKVSAFPVRQGITGSMERKSPLPEDPELVILSGQTARNTPEVQPYLEKGISVWSDLELASQYFFCLSIALAGTNGKTTTDELIQGILLNAQRKCLKAGGSGTPVCEVVERTRELDFISLELNAFQLESIEHYRPAVAVILNLKPDFMDRYEQMANYVRTVARVFENQQAFDWLIVQSEALAHLHSLGIKPRGKVITFSARNRHADIWLDHGLLVSRIPGWEGPLLNVDQVRLKGPHNAENLMAALAVGRVLRVPLDIMVDALREHQPGPHRCERVAEHQGIIFVNDSKAMNVDAVQKAIEAMPAGTGGEPNLWLIAGGIDKGLDFHDLGPLLAQRVKGAFLLGGSREKLRSAWSLFTPCVLVESLLEAVSRAAKSAAAGDVVLLSPGCSSLDMFQSYQQRGEMFREAVEKWAEQPVGALDAS
ncbi:MAG: UDP-N-acetylmuramoyl-L-alanine--D-glutamate ligase [Verrucomicrobiota bacterium]|nr:UDP-N-acetylmuramoyl-L-alanine--D-glutamate ligase [Verrucomicrobiota bacterium]